MRLACPKFDTFGTRIVAPCEVLTMVYEESADGISIAQAAAVEQLRGNLLGLLKSVTKAARDQTLASTTRGLTEYSAFELVAIHISPVHADGLACVGWEFASIGNPDRGTGVLTHGDRVLAVGAADLCVLSWQAVAALAGASKRPALCLA